MALTRPRIGQFDTSSTTFSDPITVLHGGSTTANVDVGFLMNRANGLVSNVALYWNESGNTFVTAFTSNTGGTDSNILVTSYAPITVGNVITSNGVFWSNGVAYSSGSSFSSNILAISGTVSTSNVTGALVITGGGGIGVAGNVYVGNRHGYVWAANNVSSAYTVFNNTVNSIDTVFG